MCPFHDEKHLRLQFLKINKYAIALVVKRWKCFQFIQDIKDISFVEAVQELGERVNIKVDIGHSNPSTTQIASEDLKMIEMHELINEYICINEIRRR